MRWLSWFILAYVAIGLQVGLGGFLRWGGAAPNLGLIAVIFIAIHAPRDSALLGCFLMGLMQDLLAQHPLGLYALGYGLTAMVAQSAAQVVYRNHALTHFFMALFGGIVCGGIVWLESAIHPPGPVKIMAGGATLGAIRLSLGTVLISALYTATLAPLLMWPLQKIRRVFAFQPGHRRRMATGRGSRR